MTKAPAHSHSVEHDQVEQPLVPKNASGDLHIYIYSYFYIYIFPPEVSTVCNGAYPTYTSTWRPPASPGLGQGRAELSRHAHSDSGHSLDTANLFSAAAAAGVNPACYSQELRSKMSDYSGWRY